MGAHAAGLAPGTQLGRYTLVRRFAIGGMAELYLAQQTGAAGFSKIVALKRILPHLAHEDTFTQMFLAEAKLASDLGHPNLAHVLDFGEADGEHFLTMEYVHGVNLLEALKRARRPLPLEAALQIVIDVARGLHELHEHRSPDGRPLGLVHRDVSPSNVLLAYDGSVKLTDFGIAKAMDLTSATRTGTFKGKLGHSSPEQARGESIDRRSDVFCLGILLYEVTTGTRAFSGANEFAVLGKVARASYEPPEEVLDGYPPGLSAIVHHALAAVPEDRPESAAAFAEAIAAFGRTQGIPIGPTSVAKMMRELFGEPPPIADPEELDRVSTIIDLRGGTRVRGADTLHPTPSPSRPWLSYALVPLALLLGAAGALALRSPDAVRLVRPGLHSIVPDSVPTQPVAVAQAEPAETTNPQDEQPPNDERETALDQVRTESAQTPERRTRPPRKKARQRRGRRGTKPKVTEPKVPEPKATKREGTLFPPDL
ncbi:MAG: serine/threonine-protein kinase [Nannocystaceae bacterium]|nr:serine/threonine protein kinase [bacterium]